jgi:hypothetical protein
MRTDLKPYQTAGKGCPSVLFAEGSLYEKYCFNLCYTCRFEQQAKPVRNAVVLLTTLISQILLNSWFRSTQNF